MVFQVLIKHQKLFDESNVFFIVFNETCAIFLVLTPRPNSTCLTSPVFFSKLHQPSFIMCRSSRTMVQNANERHRRSLPTLIISVTLLNSLRSRWNRKRVKWCEREEKISFSRLAHQRWRNCNSFTIRERATGSTCERANRAVKGECANEL